MRINLRENYKEINILYYYSLDLINEYMKENKLMVRGISNINLQK